MFSLPSLKLGRVFGIPVEVNLSWLLIFLLIIVSLTTQDILPDRPVMVDIAVSAGAALLFFASIVLHEVAHSLVARAGGIPIDRVTLFVFGGLAQMGEEPRTAGHELTMALAGPGASIVISAAAFHAGNLVAAAGAPDFVVTPLAITAWFNLSVAVFNLMPGFPLDGGRVFRAVLWLFTRDLLKATRVASLVGRGLGALMIAGAVFGVLRGQIQYVWLAVLGWFLTGLAETAYRQQLVTSRLEAVRIAEVMSPAVLLAPAEFTLEQMSMSYFLSDRGSRYPVVDAGTLVGLIDAGASDRVPRDRWATTTVRDIADRDLGHLITNAESSVASVLPRLGTDSPGALLVVAGGRLVGMLTRGDVSRAIGRA